MPRVSPWRTVPPPTEHANGRKPASPRVIPEIPILPVQAFVAGIIQIVPEQSGKGLRCGNRAARNQDLMMLPDLEMDGYRLVGSRNETCSPPAKVIEPDKQTLFRGV